MQRNHLLNLLKTSFSIVFLFTILLLSWERKWINCQHPDHWKNAKYDQSGQQDGWQCRNCGYSVCKNCSSPEYSPCPRCGAS